jgi:hypothetical protein
VERAQATVLFENRDLGLGMGDRHLGRAFEETAQGIRGV